MSKYATENFLLIEEGSGGRDKEMGHLTQKGMPPWHFLSRHLATNALPSSLAD